MCQWDRESYSDKIVVVSQWDPYTNSSSPREPALKVFLITLPCPMPFSPLEAKAQSLMHSTALLWVGTPYACASMSLGRGDHVGRQPLLLIKFTELQGLDFVTSDYSCRSDSHINFLLLNKAGKFPLQCIPAPQVQVL